MPVHASLHLGVPNVPKPVSARLSIAEFLAQYGHLRRVELEKGIVKELPMPGLMHGMICVNIASAIKVHSKAHNLGRVMGNDSWLPTGPDTVRGADVQFYSYERLPREQAVPEQTHTLPPDLAIEVKSPSDTWTAVFVKIGEYLQAGVRVVLVLDPDSVTVSVYRPEEIQRILTRDDTLTLPDVLPGFSVRVGELFE